MTPRSLTSSDPASRRAARARANSASWASPRASSISLSPWRVNRGAVAAGATVSTPESPTVLSIQFLLARQRQAGPHQLALPALDPLFAAFGRRPVDRRMVHGDAAGVLELGRQRGF